MHKRPKKHKSFKFNLFFYRDCSQKEHTKDEMKAFNLLLLCLTCLIRDCAAGGTFTKSSIEWAGAFEISSFPSSGRLHWTYHKVGGSYADPSIRVAVVQGDDIVQLESTASDLISNSCVTVRSGGSVSTAQNACYELIFDEAHNSSTYDVVFSSSSSVTFFTNHHPAEFDARNMANDENGSEFLPQMEKQYAISHAHDTDHSHDPVADDHGHDDDHSHDPVATDHEHDSDDHGHDYAWVSVAISVTSFVLSLFNTFMMFLVVLFRCFFRKRFESLIGIEMASS
tara:strand:+ start:948 stop:1796 length:849 start_codon:yes stop_codon:yes gene_type:complete